MILRRLLPVYTVIFFGYIGYSLIITVFTPMFLNDQGKVLPDNLPEKTRILALGFVIFLYPFGQFLSSPVLGALADRFGRRPILLFSLVISTLVYAFIGYGILLNSFWLIAASLFISGFSEGNITIAQSMIADLAPYEERSRFFGYIYLSASFSYILGPLLGGKFASPKIYPGFSYETPFFVVSILLFLTLFWIFFSCKETLDIQKRVRVSYFEAFTNLKNLFFLKRVRFLFFVNFLLYLAIFGYFQSFPVYVVSRFDVQVGKLSLFIAWGAFPFLLVNGGLTGFLAKRFHPKKIIITSALLIGLFLEILLIPTKESALWVTLFIVGFFIAICLPAIIAHLSHTSEQNEQGRVMGINQSLQFFAEAISGLVVGLLAAIFVKLALIAFGILSFIGALLLARTKFLKVKRK